MGPSKPFVFNTWFNMAGFRFTEVHTSKTTAVSSTPATNHHWHHEKTISISNLTITFLLKSRSVSKSHISCQNVCRNETPWNPNLLLLILGSKFKNTQALRGIGNRSGRECHLSTNLLGKSNKKRYKMMYETLFVHFPGINWWFLQNMDLWGVKTRPGSDPLSAANASGHGVQDLEPVDASSVPVRWHDTWKMAKRSTARSIVGFWILVCRFSLLPLQNLMANQKDLFEKCASIVSFRLIYGKSSWMFKVFLAPSLPVLVQTPLTKVRPNTTPPRWLQGAVGLAKFVKKNTF